MPDTIEMHTFTHTQGTLTMSPVNETLEYEYRHRNKGTDQVWYLKDEVCRIETKKATKTVCVPNTIETHTLTHS